MKTLDEDDTPPSMGQPLRPGELSYWALLALTGTVLWIGQAFMIARGSENLAFGIVGSLILAAWVYALQADTSKW